VLNNHDVARRSSALMVTAWREIEAIPMDLAEKTAVVTGGASGIGRALVEELVSRGCKVAIADIDGERAEAVARDIGAHAIWMKTDVGRHESVQELAAFAESGFGRVDLVFANAGVGLGGPLLERKPEELDWIFGVNVRGVWSTVSVFAKQMIRHGHRGRICVTASEHAFGLQHAGAGFYTASKHAVLGLAEVFRAELPESVGVSVFCPGLVATQLHLSRRHSPFPKRDPAREVAAAELMARGMPPREVARATVDGTLRGDFLIVTHPSSIKAAKSRSDEIMAAFAEQAPWSPEADRYDVSLLIKGLGAEHVKPPPKT
jgi:NAD(P)-dependent dehydrogenase (short-subunit alcohol dehydrogenase family)